MNIEIRELQEIAQRLDDYMRDYGNSTALDVAADAIATELDDRNTVVNRMEVRVTYLIDVKHRRCDHEEAIDDAICAYIDEFPYHRNDLVYDIVEEDLKVTPDVTV